MLYQISRNQKLLVMVGVMLAMFLSSLDQMIVATSIPKIVKELNGLEHLSWVITAYMLSSTVVVPIYGKLSDIYGRKGFIISGILIFLIGSVFSGLSQNMFQLIASRAVQGIGGGAIFANAFAIIGDLFPPAERGKWQGLTGGVFALSSVIGPTLGGFLTDNFSWRWNFFINIPVGILALVAIFFLMPKITSHTKDRSIDYAGAIFLSISIISLLLGFVASQSGADLTSQVLLFLTAFVSSVLFILVEREVKEPILPLDLFKNRIFTVSSILVFLVAFGMFGSILFVPIFAQLVLGVTATSSGAILTPMMLSIVAGSIISGQTISRFGRYKPQTIIGFLIFISGLFLLSRMTSSTSENELILRMVITGLGLGLTNPVFTLAVQNAFDYSRLGVVTSSSQLFRSIGGVMGVTILGNLMNTKLRDKIPDLFDKVQNIQSTGMTSQVPGSMAVLNKIKDAFASSITDLFLIETFVLVFALFVSFFLKEIPLRKTHHEGPSEFGRELAMEEGNFPSKDEIEF